MNNQRERNIFYKMTDNQACYWIDTDVIQWDFDETISYVQKLICPQAIIDENVNKNVVEQVPEIQNTAEEKMTIFEEISEVYYEYEKERFNDGNMMMIISVVMLTIALVLTAIYLNRNKFASLYESAKERIITALEPVETHADISVTLDSAAIDDKGKIDIPQATESTTTTIPETEPKAIAAICSESDLLCPIIETETQLESSPPPCSPTPIDNDWTAIKEHELMLDNLRKSDEASAQAILTARSDITVNDENIAPTADNITKPPLVKTGSSFFRWRTKKPTTTQPDPIAPTAPTDTTTVPVRGLTPDKRTVNNNEKRPSFRQSIARRLSFKRATEEVVPEV